jgi:ApaG protein
VSVCVTHGIKISVEPRYLQEESEPEQDKYMYAYQVTIENEGNEPAQLLTRHWIIKDAYNHIEQVRGEGVVGEQPLVEPGESFTYTSWCPLRTDFGIMRGSYGMARPSGETFEAKIAPFALLPYSMLN